MSKFEYPRLSRPEIVRIITDTQIASISEHDLLRPKFDFVSDLYTRFLVYLDVLHEEDSVQFEFTALEQFEDPDHHVDSVPTMKLWVRMKVALSSLKCPKRFNLSDLVAPDGDRTEYFVGALLNFLLHRETKMSMLSPAVNELTLIEEQRQEWEEKLAVLNAELASLNESREMELPLVQEVDAKVKELHQVVVSLNAQQSSLRTFMRKLKEKIGEKDEKISSAEFALIQTVEEIASLRSKLVQSPEKVQKALEEIKLLLEEAKNAERLAMQSFHKKTAVAEVYSQVLKKVKKQLAKMQAIQEQVNSAKLVDKDHKALKAKLSDEAVVEKSLQAKLLERRGKVEQLEELNRVLEKERDAKCEEASKELNRVKLEVESRRLSLEARQKTVEAVVSEVDAITAKTTSIKESAIAQQQELLLRYEAILKEFDEYMDAVEAALTKYF